MRANHISMQMSPVGKFSRAQTFNPMAARAVAAVRSPDFVRQYYPLVQRGSHKLTHLLATLLV